jgi:hypothetical protein
LLTSLAAPDIRLGGIDHLSLLEDLPKYEENNENRDANVRCKEIGDFVMAPRSLGEN